MNGLMNPQANLMSNPALMSQYNTAAANGYNPMDDYSYLFGN
jgi:hypothetical protein